MSGYEYKVVPAPKRGVKAKGLKTSDARYANALQATLNSEAIDGWEYLRAETLPSEERSGLTGRTTVFQNVLVFRREQSEDDFFTDELLAIEAMTAEGDEEEYGDGGEPLESIEESAAETDSSNDDQSEKETESEEVEEKSS